MDFSVADVTLPDSLKSSPALTELKDMRGNEGEVIEGEGAGGLRYKAIRQEALRLGAQTGLAYRYTMIMEYMQKKEPQLNVAFNFSGFVKDGRLLIPAIQETKNNFAMDYEKGEAVITRLKYTVDEEARIVSVVPTWRDYLWQQYAYPEKPHPSLRPRTKEEVLAWKESLDAGWLAGVSQADSIYDDRIASLTKAVEGRHLYTLLESKKAFTPAALKVVENKITFNGRTMNVGEVIYSIEAPANYTQASEWKPVWTR